MSKANARKSNRSLKNSILVAVAAAAPNLVGSAFAQTAVTWDADGTTTGAIVDGLGTWDTTAANFWNGVANAAWNNANNDIAVFGAGTTGGLITIPAPITLGGLTVNNTGYTIGTSAAGTLTFAGTAPAITMNASGTLNTPIAGASAIDFNVASTATATIGLNCTANNTGGFNMYGGGTITIPTTGGTFTTGAGTLGGINLIIPNNKAFGTFSGANTPLNIKAGTTNRLWAVSGGNGVLSSNLVGSGTVDLGAVTAGSIMTVNGDNSAFQGTITTSTTALIRFNNATKNGSGQASWDIGTTGRMCGNGNNATIPIGALYGQPGSGLYGRNDASGTTTWLIGGLGVDTSYSGGIFDGGNGTLSNVDHNRKAAITKVGTGKLTLTAPSVGSNSFTGSTKVDAGTLAITSAAPLSTSANVSVNNGAGAFDVTGLGAAYTIPVGQTISGSGGTAYGDFSLGATTARINPGTNGTGIGTVGTINFANTLTLAGGTINLDLTNSTTQGGGVNDLLTINNLDITAASKIIVSPVTSGTLTVGTYRLINYTSATNLGSLTFASTAPLNATLDTSIAGQINLIVNALGNPQNLRWNGPGGDWDLNTNLNWFNTDTSAGTVFFQGDSVTFDDTVGAPTTVNVVGLLTPASITVDSSTNNFTFTGSGTIGGTGMLTKRGTSNLTINTANSYSGGTKIEAGTVTVGNAAGLGTFAVNLAGGNLMVSGGVSVPNAININSTNSTLGGDGSFSGAINVNVNSFKGFIATGRTITLNPGNIFQFPLGPATMDFGASGAGFLRFAGQGSPQGIGGNLIVDLGTGSLTMNTRDGNTGAGSTIFLAGLAGGSNTFLRGATNTANASKFAIGGVDITTVFNGSILNGTAGSNAVVNLIKDPIGTLVLNGNSTTTGTVVINDQGTLIVNGQYSGGGAVTVDGALGGAGVIAGPTTINNRVAPGNGNGAVGTLGVGTLTLTNPQVDIELGGGNGDRLASSGALTVTGSVAVNLSDAGGATPGRYVIVDYNGAALADLNTWSLNGASIAGSTATLSNNTLNTSVDLVVPNPTAVTSEWSNASGGDFAQAGNWTAGTPSGADSVANLGPAVNGAAITLNAAQTIGFASFSSSGAYSISGSGSLTLDVTGGYTGMTVMSGSHSIAVPVVASDEAIFAINTGAALSLGALSAPGNTITKSGPGQLTASNIQATTLNATAGSTQISAKGSPNSAPGTSVVNNLSIAAGASLNLTDNALVIDYTTLGSGLATVRGHLSAGRLTSTSATGGMALGYADAASVSRTSFGGASLDGTAIIVGLIYAGDANFDGKVNTIDFNQLAGGFGGTGKVWLEGDFSYDGLIDSTDFNAMVGNFGASMSLPGPSLGAVVPEPTTLAGAAVLVGLAMRRRR